MSAAFSAIIIVEAQVLADGMFGIMEASALLQGFKSVRSR
jgi:hypothetical protein